MLDDQLIALACCVIASFFTSTGLTLIKIANIKVENDKKKSVYFKPEFLVAVVCLILSQSINASKLYTFVYV